MPLPDDLKNYSADDDDGFQLVDPQTAGAVMFFGLAVLLVLERAGIL